MQCRPPPLLSWAPVVSQRTELARAVYFRVQMAPRELHSSFTTLLYSESDTLMPCTGAKRAVIWQGKARCMGRRLMHGEQQPC